MSELELEHMYFYITRLKKFMNNRKVKDWNIRNVFIRGKKDVRIVKALTSFMSYYRSSHFNELEFQTYFLLKLLEEENFLNLFKQWNASEVKNISLGDSKESLKKDQEFLIEVSKVASIKSLEKYFDINIDGESTIYSFFAKGYISIHFLIEYSMYFKESEEQTMKHKHIVKIVKQIRKIQQNYKEK